MLKFIENFNSWLEELVMNIYVEKYFLYIMGSLFLLGIVTKWMVVRFYGRLHRKAEDMTNPRSAILRQIKMKFEGIKQVNGTVVSPVLLVKRYINKARVGMISVNRLNHIINWCSIGSIFLGGVMGVKLYQMGYSKDIALVYVIVGGIFAFMLEIIDRNVHVREMKEDLACTIVDFIENNAIAKEQRHIESINDLTIDEIKEANVKTAESIKREEEEKKYQEEQIVNQVLGEFLQ